MTVLQRVATDSRIGPTTPAEVISGHQQRAPERVLRGLWVVGAAAVGAICGRVGLDRGMFSTGPPPGSTLAGQ